jgi:hypothetical protein
MSPETPETLKQLFLVRLKKGEKNFVSIDGVELLPDESLAHVNHSPDGFNWGYTGSGPHQLAFALLLKLRGLEYAQSNYRHFCHSAVATWKEDDLEIDLEIL